eukprot:scaffold5.g899.t1
MAPPPPPGDDEKHGDSPTYSIKDSARHSTDYEEVCKAAAEPAATAAADARLSRRSLTHSARRDGDALQRHSVAPVVTRKAPTKPLKSMLRNSWVLAIMTGIVAIMIVFKSRITKGEPLENVHATNGLAPFLVPAPNNDYIDYLFLNIIVGPQFPQDNATRNSTTGAGRRRLAAWVAEALATRDAASSRPTPDAEEQLARAARKLLASPKCTLARRVLLQTEPSDSATETTLPQLKIVFEVQASELKGLGPAKNWLALAIVLLVLLAIASERIHRMWVAMIGCSLMLGLLLLMRMPPSLGTAVEWLDQSTLSLLWGMMVIVGRLKDTGMFEVLSAWTVRISRGKLWILSTLLMVVTGFVSAWLDNVTTMLLMAPVTISMMKQCNADPVPLLVAQALMSNIGGTGGRPSSSDHRMAPGVILAAAICTPLILFLCRKTMLGRVENFEAVAEESRHFRVTDWDLFAKSSYVTAAVVVAFLLHPVHHVDPAWFALLGAIVLCVCDDPMEVDKVVRSVEWDMLLFFAAMFVMIEASAEIGMIDMIGGWLESAIRAAPEGSRTIVAIQILLWITMVPIIEYLAASGLGLDLATLAWALDFGACFGGNATLIGASANIVTATLVDRAGLRKVTFMSWLWIGLPVTAVSVAVADVWMILRFCL